MTQYRDIVSALSTLEYFDHRAFLGDSAWPQELCDVFLALALAYNDFKDVMMGHAILSSAAPPGKPSETPQWGHHNGVRAHLTRVQCAMVFELLELVRTNSVLLTTSQFVGVLKKLPPADREAWAALEDVALQRKTSRPLAEALQFVRNKVAYHYDLTQISEGFRTAFSSGLRGNPLLSRGNDLPSTRFYFADAAAFEAYTSRSQSPAITAFLTGDLKLLSDIHHALYFLVTTFIQARRPWREHRLRT